MLKTPIFKRYWLVVFLILGTVGNMVKRETMMAVPLPKNFFLSQRQVNKPILSKSFEAKSGRGNGALCWEGLA